MFAAAAAFIYFDESLVIRLISGCVFLFAVVGLYFVLSRAGDESEETTEQKPSSEKAVERPAPPVSERPAQVVHHNEPQTVPMHTPVTILREEERAATEIPRNAYADSYDHRIHDDPRAEYDFITDRLLDALQEHISANTVALFWMNYDRQQVVLGEFVSASNQITTARRFALGSDVISRIAYEGKPVILSDIATAAESDLIFYYDHPEGVRSFIGVPMFFEDELVAVLVADSKASDAFGSETVNSIGRINTLISILLASVNQKFELAGNVKTLQTMEAMQDEIFEHYDLYGVASACLRAAAASVDWDFLAVVAYKPDKQNWIVIRSQAKSAAVPYVAEGVTADLTRSVFRNVLESGEGEILLSPALPAFRFHEKEVITSTGEMMAIPLRTPRQLYGLLIVEYREQHQYSARDLEMLRRIGLISAGAIEAISLGETTRKYLMIDETTRTASRSLLLRRLDEELERLKTFKGNHVFFLLRLDGYQDFVQKHGRNSTESALHQISNVLKEQLPAFDILGRFDEDKLGIILINTNAEDAYLRGEKLRKAIASHIQALEGQTFSLTVSLAGCTMAPGMNSEHVLRISQQALSRAIDDGGNCVKVV